MRNQSKEENVYELESSGETSRETEVAERSKDFLEAVDSGRWEFVEGNERRESLDTEEGSSASTRTNTATGRYAITQVPGTSINWPVQLKGGLEGSPPPVDRPPGPLTVNLLPGWTRCRVVSTAITTPQMKTFMLNDRGQRGAGGGERAAWIH